MSYQLIDRYCVRCHSLTPHETDGDRGQCIVCEKKRPLHVKAWQGPHTTQQFIHALDGAGNRGEKR